MTDERAPGGAPEPNPEPAGEAPAAEEATSPAMPAYTPPAYTPPPVPPPAMPQPAMAQPAVAWAAPPAAAAVQGSRTTLSLVAGILLVVLGLFGALASLALLTIGREFIRQFDFSTLPGLEQVNDPSGFVESAAIFGGILVLAFSTFYIVGGVGVMRSKNWGRVIGIVIGILASLFWVAGVAGGGRASGGDTSFALVLLAIHAYVAIVLLFFWRNKSPA
jgi:hypothetical protein